MGSVIICVQATTQYYVGKIGIDKFVQMGTHMCILVRQLSGHIWALVIPHIVHQLHQMDQC